MKNKSISQSVLTGLFVVLVLAASNSIVRAQGCPSTTWIFHGGGDWFTPGNWSGCVPNITTDAHINNSGQAQIHGSNVQAATYSLWLGDNQGDSGGVTVYDSAILDVGSSPSCRGDIYIGNQGSGNLAISNGGIVRNRYAYIAAAPASYGKVSVSGYGPNFAESQWNLNDVAGCPGAGLFIGCTAGSNGVGGTALVDVESPARITVVSSVNAPGVTVGLSGTLTGNGILQLGGGNTLLSQTATVLGTLAPATPVLTIEGNLTLAHSATTVFNLTPQIPPTAYQVAVMFYAGHGIGGTATLNGRVSVTMTGTFTPGTTFTLLHADAALHGTFFTQSIKYPSGGPCFTPKISYDAYNVYLNLEACL